MDLLNPRIVFPNLLILNAIDRSEAGGFEIVGDLDLAERKAGQAEKPRILKSAIFLETLDIQALLETDK